MGCWDSITIEIVGGDLDEPPRIRVSAVGGAPWNLKPKEAPEHVQEWIVATLRDMVAHAQMPAHLAEKAKEELQELEDVYVLGS